MPSYFLPPSAIAFSPYSSRLANCKQVYELLPKPSGKIGNAGADQVSSLCATHHMSCCGGKRFEFCNTLLKSVKHRCPSLFQPHPRSSGSTDFMLVQPLRAQTRYLQLPMAVTPDVKRFSQAPSRLFPPFSANFHPSVQNQSTLQLIYQHVPKWLYNIYVDMYNLSIVVYNRLVERWNRNASEEPEENIIPTETYNQQVEAYNRHVDRWNQE